MDTMRPNEITVLPIPEGVTEITEKEAFPCRADLKCVQIPDGVVKIGDEAFMSCPELEEIYLPDSVKEIGVGAFFHCRKLKTIHIPSGVTTTRSHVVPRRGYDRRMPCG